MTAVEFERTATSDESVSRREIAAELRSVVLLLAPVDIGIDPLAASVWGIVIETAHPDAVASLVALADGSVSLYVSDGSGCVGCGAHRDVRFAGADLLEVAGRSLALATPTDDIDYPPAGNIRFYFLSSQGLRSAQVRLEDLNTVNEQLSALYFAGQRVINAIERVGAGQSLEQEIRLALLARQSTPAKGSPSCLSVGNAVRRLRI